MTPPRSARDGCVDTLGEKYIHNQNFVEMVSFEYFDSCNHFVPSLVGGIKIFHRFPSVQNFSLGIAISNRLE